MVIIITILRSYIAASIYMEACSILPGGEARRPSCFSVGKSKEAGTMGQTGRPRIEDREQQAGNEKRGMFAGTWNVCRCETTKGVYELV